MNAVKIRSNDIRLFNVLGYAVVSLAAMLCLLPFLVMISGSFSSNDAILTDGYRLWPREPSLDAYRFVFRFPASVLQAYGVTILVTSVGTTAGLFLITMTAYVLQRRDYRYRNQVAFFLYFTTIFQGGLIPLYIMITQVLQIRNTYFVLIWNMIMSPFLIILMRSFMQSSIQQELVESAKIDGANDFTIFVRVVLPLCAPAMATVGLFLALGYWNDWFNAALFIDDRDKYPLQYFLYNTLTTAQFMSQQGASMGVINPMEIPGETAKLAMALVGIGPIVVVFPFIQRYFIRGIKVSAIKG
jgi:putative aldouronate transport system permease protein